MSIYDGDNCILDFTEEFFLEGNRCDFVIEKKMKRAWASSMEVLALVDRICSEYNLRYFVYYGTLLGTIRHSGFVPWDDDIDIMMPRADFNTLKKVLVDYKSDEMTLNDNLPINALLSTSKVLTNESIPKRFHGCRFITGLDIFVADYLPRDRELRESFIGIYAAIYDIYVNYDEYLEQGLIFEKVNSARELSGINIADNISKEDAWKLCEQISGAFSEEESDILTWLPGVYLEEPLIMKKEWFSEMVYKKFENMEVAVPNGYEEILTKIYGDWRVMEHVEASHDYPYYKEQDKYLKSLGLSEAD